MAKTPTPSAAALNAKMPMTPAVSHVRTKVPGPSPDDAKWKMREGASRDEISRGMKRIRERSLPG